MGRALYTHTHYLLHSKLKDVVFTQQSSQGVLSVRKGCPTHRRFSSHLSLRQWDGGRIREDIKKNALPST